jgi:integrase
MLAHLQAKEIPLAGLRRATFAARKFWQWLCEEGMVVDPSQPLLLRNPRAVAKPTPLAYTATPADILAFVATVTDPDVRFMALAGYFCSLRPFEVCALRPRDFVAGSAAAALDSGDAMQRMSLFARLAVHVHRERAQNGDFHPPKAHSVGYVSAFDARAAQHLVALLNGLDPDALVVKGKPDYCLKRWRKIAWPRLGLTLKDLRRASIYWLGHHTQFSGAPLLLQKHARHKSLDTTQLYLRRPEEPEADWAPLDLDA